MGNNAAGYEELLVVMEWCPAGVPDLLRERGGFLDRQETTKVFYQACSAIGVLHKMSPPAVHRDIKGENLLISSQGIIKLCDFGSVTTQTVNIKHNIKLCPIGPFSSHQTIVGITCSEQKSKKILSVLQHQLIVHQKYAIYIQIIQLIRGKICGRLDVF